MPLIIAPLNLELKVVKILADALTTNNLKSLGITVDSIIISKGLQNQNIICIVNDNKIVLDKEIATQIIVA
jgi:Fe2+ transport system protein FeoA